MVSTSQGARALLLGLAGLLSLTDIGVSQEPRTRIGVLLAAGDFMSCQGSSRLNAHENVAGMIREIKAARDEGLPVAVLLLGDLGYDDGGENSFVCFHDEVTQPLSEALSDPNSAIMPVPGNHDMETLSGKWFYDEFKDNQWIGDGRAGDDKGYYTMAFPEGTTGAWRLFGINSQIDTQPNGSQYLWLQEALEGVSERCVLAFWHAPVFSSGHHGHDESDDFENAKPVKQTGLSPVFDLFFEAQTSLVLNGHDHDFEHLAPHNSSGEAVDNGLRAFVVGTGGKRLYREYAQKLPIKLDFDSKDYGFLKLDMYPDGYDWQFLKAGNISQALYNGSGTCNQR